MSLAIVLGVWVSIRIGIGQDIRRHPSFTWWVVNRLAFLVAGINLAGFMVFFLQERFVELRGEKAAGPARRSASITLQTGRLAQTLCLRIRLDAIWGCPTWRGRGRREPILPF
jgi:hypothetical protein